MEKISNNTNLENANKTQINEIKHFKLNQFIFGTCLLTSLKVKPRDSVSIIGIIVIIGIFIFSSI